MFPNHAVVPLVPFAPRHTPGDPQPSRAEAFFRSRLRRPRALKKRPPPLCEEVAGAATFSRFVSTIPGELCIRLSATLQVPKNGPDAGWQLNVFPRSVQYWTDVANFPASIGMPDGYPLPYLAV
jgi:hypothetical protein